VVMAGNPAESVAILVADGKPSQAVRVGRDLLPGVTVKEVGRNHVLLSEDGQEKRVELPAELAPQTLAPRPAPAPAPARAAPPPTRTAPAVPSTLQRGPGNPGAAPAIQR